MACRTSFLSRQSDIIASFSFGAHAVYTDFFCQWKTLIYLLLILQRVFFHHIILLRGTYRPLWNKFYQLQCLHLAKNTEIVGTSWLPLTAIIFVQGVGRKERALTRVFLIRTVTHAILLLKNNVLSCLRLLIGSRKKSVTPRNLLKTPNRTPVPLSLTRPL